MLASALAYVLNFLVLKPTIENWFVHSYLNDLFAMPFILAYSNLLILWGGRRDLLFVSLRRILFLTLVCGLTWEFAAPLIKSSAVFDPFDFLAYSIGSCAYYVIFNCKNYPHITASARCKV